MALIPSAQTAAPSPSTSFKHMLFMALVLSFAYVVSGKLSLLLAIPPGYASAIFPPAGIAVTAAFIAGRRAIPGILFGSFLLNLWIGFESSHMLSLLGSAAAFLIACASLMQAMIGAWILRKVIHYPAAFDNLRDVLAFQLLSPVICLISASLSVSALVLLGMVPASSFLMSWFMWWVGDTLGLLVLLPLTMVVAGEPRALWRKRASTVAIPMLFAFSLLVVLYVNVSRWEQTESLLEFRLQSQRIADTIQAHLESQESLLEQTHGFFAGTDQVSADDFHRFSQEALKRFPMLRAMDWAPRIESTARRQFEADQQTRLPGFAIKDRNQGDRLQTAAERTHYYPVTFVEPLHGNEAALGFDILSTPDRAEAVAKAIQTGRSVATPPLHLLQAPDQPYGFLLLHAVTNSRSGDGVVLTIIRADQFLEKLLPQDQSQLQIRLTDVQTQQVIHNTFSTADAPALWQQKLIYGQREFLLATAPSATYLAQHRGWQSAVFLAVSILGTGLLGAFLMLGTGYTARVEAQVEEKIAELSESTEKLTGLYELSPLGIALSDMNGRFIDFNESFRRISGYSAEELTQLDNKSLTPSKYKAIDAAQFEQLMLYGRYGPYEKEFLNKNGLTVPVSLNGLRLHGKNGEQYIWSIVEDISERIKASEALRDSEERWKFALEGSGDGLWDWNLQTGDLYLSKQEMVVLGYANEDAQFTNISTRIHLLHPQDLALRQAAMDDYFACKVPIYTCEFRTRTPEGRWKWILARGILVSHTPDGQPLRMIGTHTDINERKRMQSKEAMRSTVMEMLARGARLREILDTVITTLETENEELVYAIFNNNDEDNAQTAGTGLPLLWYPQQPEIDTAVAPSIEAKHPFIGDKNHLDEVVPSAGVELCHSELITSDGDFIEGILVSFRKLSGSSALPDIEQQQQAAALIGIAIQHKRIEEQLLLANSVYMASSEAIMVVDEENRIVAVNPAFEIITGFNLSEAIGRDPKFMQSAHQSQLFYQTMWQSILASGTWHGELWNQRKNGSIYPLNMHISSILGEDGQVLRRIAIFTDITEKKLAEEQINHLAHYDLLTNLPNRALYADRLSQALATARRNDSHVALLYVDLDKFKPVNDSLGHAVGDGLLKQVAQRMLACVRESDTIARIGGDEFVAILPSVQTEQNARLVGEKIRSALEAPFIVDGHELSISASIGGAIYPEHGEDEAQLMQNADSAMYSAKKGGRNTVHIFGQAEA